MKIAIVKLSALGDIVHAMVILQFLKKKYPACSIDWIVEESFKEILENNPHINAILPVNLKSLKKKKSNIFQELRRIKFYAKNNYDIVIDAQGLLKSAIVTKLLRPKKSVGFDKYSTRESIASLFYDTKVQVPYDENVIIRNTTLANITCKTDISKQDILEKEPFLFYKEYTVTECDVLFVLGASKENKIYPKEHFLTLAALLQTYTIHCIWANEYEKKAGEFLAKNAQNVTLCEAMSLDALKQKIAKSKLVIGADTGPTHMAWALNTPSVTIFGNTPHTRNTFETKINKVIASPSKVNPFKLDKNDFSIREIEPKEVADLALHLLQKSS